MSDIAAHTHPRASDRRKADKANAIARAADTFRNYGLIPGAEITTVQITPKSWRLLMIGNPHSAGELIVDVTLITATLAGFRMNRQGDAIQGAQSAWWIVYAIGRSMWPEGVERPANVNRNADARDGGYALRHRCL